MQFNTEIELGVGLPLFGSQLVPLEGCLVIFGDTISTVVKDTQTYLRFSLPRTASGFHSFNAVA